MKKWICLFTLLLFLASFVLGSESQRGQRVRKLYLKRDDIALVRTAVGIATLIQVPDRPTSVVLGDTNAFKVEYLDNAITIKPLSHSSRSNLYIYTEARRFSVSLVTAPQAGADYIVYLEPESRSPELVKERWRAYRTEKSNSTLNITIRRLGTVSDLLMVDLSIVGKKDINFSPEWIWLTQNGKTIPIQNLSLTGVKLSPRTTIQGLLSVKRGDIPASQPFTLEVRGPSPISIRLPGGPAWMK